jgi:HK97 family phage portal protein
VARQGIISRTTGAVRELYRSARGLIFSGSYGGGQGGGTRQWFSPGSWFGGAYNGSNLNYQALLGDPSASSLAMAAVNWVGDRLPEAELQVVQTDGEDNEKPVPNHPLVELLRRPNPYYSGATLWKHFAFSWILDGNVYWWLIFNARGQVVEIWPLPYWLVWPRWTAADHFIDFYEYQADGLSFYIPPISDTASDYKFGRILHFRDGIDPENQRVGLSRLKSIYRELYGDSEIANFSAALMRNSGVPPILVSFKEMQAGVNRDQLLLLQEDMQRRISGDERGKAMAISWPLEVKQLAFDPESLDLRKLRFIDEERFCAVIGIPSQVLGFGAASESSTYNNVETAQRDAVQRFLVPLWRYIDEELNAQMLLQRQFRSNQKQRVRHDLNSVQALQESEDKKADRIRKDVMAGILKVKDAQMLRGWPPDEKADYYLRPSSLVEVRDGVVTPMKPPPAAPAAAEPVKFLGAGVPFEYSRAIKAAHEFSSTQFNISGYAAQQIGKFGQLIDPADLHEKGIETEPHVTLKYGLHADDGEPVKELVRRFAAQSIEIEFGRMDFFADDDFDVLYVSVDGKDLRALNRFLTDNLENTATQDIYTPHATVAFLKSGKGQKYAGDGFLAGYKYLFETLIFTNKNRVQSMIPLAIEPKPLPNGKTAKTDGELLASKEDATDWLVDVLPPDAQGLESPGAE